MLAPGVTLPRQPATAASPAPANRTLPEITSPAAPGPQNNVVRTAPAIPAQAAPVVDSTSQTPVASPPTVLPPLRFAAAPAKITIGLRHKKKPRARTLTLSAEEAGATLTVSPLESWLKVTPHKATGKAGRRYEVSVDEGALPAGRVHDGVIRVSGPGGTLDIPVVVEEQSTR